MHWEKWPTISSREYFLEMKYKILVCGGTFDLLHAGHKYFLKETLDLSEKVVIGLTSDKYIIENKPNRGIASFEDRKKSLESYLEQIRVGQRVEIIPIDDFYGSLLDPLFQADALAVSENRENAMKINEERKGRGLKPLEVVEIELRRGGDGQKLSSTRIREGEVDREGKNLILPSTLRYLLQDVWGKIVSEIPTDLDVNKIITVGDVTTAKFRDLKIYPKLSIIDFKVERKPIGITKFENEQVVKVKNPAGTVSGELSKAVRKALENNTRSIIIVDGEEDLSVLPALLYAPLGYEVYYGQPARHASESVAGRPNVGLVRVKVTESIKEKTQRLISQFEPSM